MISEWKEVSIGEIGRIITGNTPPRKNTDFFGNKYIWIKPTDIKKESRYVISPEEKFSKLAFKKYNKSLLPPLTTCVVTIGTIGEKICLTKEPSFTNQAINAVIPNELEYDPKFVYYLLKYNLPKVAQRNSGTASGRQNVSKSNFASIKVKVPIDKQTQKKISSILSSFDDLIEINERKIELLKELAQGIFDEWVDSPPKSNGEAASLSNGRSASEFLVKKVKDIAIFKKGKKSDRVYLSKRVNTVPYILIDGLRNGKFEFTDDKSNFAKNDDIIMVMDGDSSGEVFIGQSGFIGSTLGYYRIIDENVSPYLLFYFLKSKYPSISRNNVGSAIPHANKDYISGLQIFLLPKKLNDTFDRYMRRIHEDICLLIEKNSLLRETNKSLLSKLISGEIDNSLLIEKVKMEFE
jgi:type I restriction enzyme S subunit